MQMNEQKKEGVEHSNKANSTPFNRSRSLPLPYLVTLSGGSQAIKLGEDIIQWSDECWISDGVFHNNPYSAVAQLFPRASESQLAYLTMKCVAKKDKAEMPLLYLDEQTLGGVK